MQAQLTLIHPLALIRRNRNLPVPGEVVVRPGQKVNGLETVAQAEVSTRHYLVDVARALSIQNPLEAEKLLQRKPGDILEKGDILVSTGGAFSRVIRTPGPGKVISTQGGRVLIEAESRQVNLQAGIDGVVARVQPDRGVMIEMSGALVQGAWGNGKVGRGPILVNESCLDGELVETCLSESSKDGILLAGWCSSASLLEQAAKVGIRGLVLGAISSNLILAAEQQPYPILSLGGFGRFGIDPLSRKLLSTSVGREAVLHASAWNRVTGERPELYIELPAEAFPLQESAELTPGQTIQVHSGPYLGKTGMISRLMPGLRSQPGGIRVAVLEVKFTDGEVVLLPCANVDVIGLPSPFLGEDEGS